MMGVFVVTEPSADGRGGLGATLLRRSLASKGAVRVLVGKNGQTTATASMVVAWRSPDDDRTRGVSPIICGMATAPTVDWNLRHRVKDVGDALQGHISSALLDAAVLRLVQAADHLGAAAVGARMAAQLAAPDGLRDLVMRFGQNAHALDTAALTLGTVSVHSALDLCAGVVLAVLDGTVPSPGAREKGMPDVRKRAAATPFPGLFADWLHHTVDDGRYDELEAWRDPQTHRPVPRGLVAGAPTPDGQLTRASVLVHRPRIAADGREENELLGTAAEKLPAFVEFGEERFLALKNVLIGTYAPGWHR
jgi:hypothetical protein